MGNVSLPRKMSLTKALNEDAQITKLKYRDKGLNEQCPHVLIEPRAEHELCAWTIKWTSIIDEAQKSLETGKFFPCESQEKQLFPFCKIQATIVCRINPSLKSLCCFVEHLKM